MDISPIRKLPRYLIALLVLVNHTAAASPREDIARQVKELGPMVVFTVPGTTFDCLDKADYQALGPQTAAMRTINGLGCKAVVNNWMGAEVTPDGLTWWFVSHGGHNAYGGNEAYRLDLSSDRPWSLHSLPSPRAKYRIAQDGGVEFLEKVQWTGCPAGVAKKKTKAQKKAARSCTLYGPGAIHTWSLPAYLNGKIYLRGWGSFGSGIHQGAWIFDPAKACIEADRAALIGNLARLNPQNVIADCDPSAAWTYLGQRGPGVATPLPQSGRILYTWQNPSQGALEDANGNVIRDSGAFGGTSTYSGVHTQWIPSLEIGVINKRAERWFYVTANGDVQSPSGVKNHSTYATVDTSAANTKIIGHFSYDPNSDNFLILEDTRLFLIERADLEDNDKAEFHEVSLDWSRISDPQPMPYNGFVHIASLDVHCMMNRGDLGEQSLMCFRYAPTTGKKAIRQGQAPARR